MGLVAHTLFIPLFHGLGFGWLALFNIGSVSAWLAARILNRRGHQTVAMALISVEVVLHAVLAVSALGWQSGFQYYLIPLVPFFLFHDALRLWVISVASAGVYLVLASLYVAFRAVSPPLDEAVVSLLHFVNVGVPMAALFVISFYYRRAAQNTERRLLKLASRDPLTGLLNRRRMLDRLRERQAQFERHGRPFSLIMADIDHFKAVNDTHGHDAGDRVLREMSAVLRDGLRTEDVVSRWGGEEYLVLLPETTLEGAARVAEKLRCAVSQRAFSINDLELTLTMTFGVAACEAEETLEDCIARADAALYDGKASGRNRVATHPPTRR